MHSEMLSDTSKDFSLVLGGPLYQFFVRIGLVRPPLDRVAWRIIVITMFAWVPLLVLTILSGRVLGGVKIPFLYDFEVQTRLLVMLPLLISAEVTIHRRVREMLLQFVERQIITPAVLPKFEGCVMSALRLRNSAAIELGLLAIVFVVGNFLWRGTMSLQSDTWYASLVAGGKVLAPAGYWYQFISVPITQFIGLRWFFRLFVGARLLWHVSKLDLRLVPSHPDRRCGLGFLGGIVFAMGPFLMAFSALLAGFIANRILHEGAKLPDYKVEILAVALLLYFLALGPICVFTPRLIRLRVQGLYTYGALASEYVIAFEKKWLEGQRPSDEPLVGSADIQSLADLGNSFEIVQTIHPFPFSKESIVGLTVIIALPLLPLIFTMFSPRELALRILNVLL